MHSKHLHLAPLHCMMSFAQAVQVKRMIERIATEPKQTFWIMVVNNLLNTAAVDWCKVFGSRNEQTHWTKAIPQAEHNAIRHGLLQAMGLQQEEWNAYQEGVVSYRDQLVAHHDLNASILSYPKYDTAMVAAVFMYSQIRQRADQDWLGGVPPDLDQWARGVAGNMSAIVRKAFTASAELGSNVQSS